MAEKLQVSSAYSAAGQPVNTVVTFTDGQNNKLELMGKPRAIYSLEAIVAGLADIQAPVAAMDGETVSFTDAAGNTITLTGDPGASYDLRKLKTLEAIVEAQGMLLRMMIGSNYDLMVQRYLQGVNYNV